MKYEMDEQDARRGEGRLDLCAITVGLAGAEHTWGRDHELLVTLRALLAHVRENRAVLQRIRDWAATEAPGWTHMIDAVLAQVSDGEAAP